MCGISERRAKSRQVKSGVELSWVKLSWFLRDCGVLVGLVEGVLRWMGEHRSQSNGQSIHQPLADSNCKLQVERLCSMSDVAALTTASRLLPLQSCSNFLGIYPAKGIRIGPWNVGIWVMGDPANIYYTRTYTIYALDLLNMKLGFY